MATGKEKIKEQIELEDIKIENVTEFTHLGTLLTYDIISVVLYACETWTLKKKDKNNLMAFEMRCYRRILNVRWQQKSQMKK